MNVNFQKLLESSSEISRSSGGSESPAASGQGSFKRLMAEQGNVLDVEYNEPERIRELSAPQTKALESHFHSQWDNHGAQCVENAIKEEMQMARSAQSILQEQSSFVPKSENYSSFHRLMSEMTADEQGITGMIERLQSIDIQSPEYKTSLLELMKEMHKFQLNVEVLSKVIGEVTSGVRKVLDLQV